MCNETKTLFDDLEELITMANGLEKDLKTRIWTTVSQIRKMKKRVNEIHSERYLEAIRKNQNAFLSTR